MSRTRAVGVSLLVLGAVALSGAGTAALAAEGAYRGGGSYGGGGPYGGGGGIASGGPRAAGMSCPAAAGWTLTGSGALITRPDGVESYVCSYSWTEPGDQPTVIAITIRWVPAGMTPPQTAFGCGVEPTDAARGYRPTWSDTWWAWGQEPDPASWTPDVPLAALIGADGVSGALYRQVASVARACTGGPGTPSPEPTTASPEPTASPTPGGSPSGSPSASPSPTGSAGPGATRWDAGLRVGATSARVGRSVSVAVTVRPVARAAGRAAVLQAKRAGQAWRALRTVTLGPKGAWNGTVSSVRPGVLSLRVLMKAPGLAADYSPVRTIRWRR